MMELKDVKKLAELAKIDIPFSEEKELLNKLQSVIEYIDHIEKAPVEEGETELVLKNVFREDKNPHDGDVYSEKLLNEAPGKQDGYIKVKKIL